MEVSWLSGVRKIAVLRANGLGDLMFALPALDALRAAYPEAEIVLLGRRWHAELWEGRPGPVDRVIELPPLRGVSAGDDDAQAPAEPAPSVLARLRAERFDLALQMHGGGRHSNPFVLALGATVTAGLRTPDAEPLDRWVPYFLHQREVARYLEVVSLVGAPDVGLLPRISVTPGDLEEAAEAGAEAGLVALHVGASDPRRRWPPARFAQVADQLVARGWRVAFTGGPEDATLVGETMSRMDRPALDLSGRLSVGGLAGLLSRCALLLGNDSGPLHLAEAVGTPTVGVYWLPNVITAGAATRSSHRLCIAWQLTCPVCGVRNIDVRCPHDDCFVAEVPAEDVLAQCLDLLDTQER